MSEKLYIYGAGGHAKVVAATARLCGYEIAGFWEDSSDRIGKAFFGSRIIAFDTIPYQSSIIIAFGNNSIRLDKGNALRDRFQIKNLIHPSAQIACGVSIGCGTYVGAFANIDPDCRVGDFCIINNGANISHETRIEDGCHICGGVQIAGNCHIGQCVMMGIGSCIIEKCSVGDNTCVGAGSTVIRDLSDNVTAVGCPARVIKYHNEKICRAH